MDGYKSIKDYLIDQRLLNLAQEIDRSRRGEMDIEKLMKINVKKRFENASKKFKKELERKKYTELDLKLLAANQSDEIDSFRAFYEIVYGTEDIQISKFKKIIRSQVFKQGKLTTLTRFIPLKIDTPRKLIGFLRRWREGITDSELEAVMSVVGHSSWEDWLQEFTEKGSVFFTNGRWQY